MPEYMDVHRNMKGNTPDDLLKAHQADLDVAAQAMDQLIAQPFALEHQPRVPETGQELAAYLVDQLATG